MKLIRNRLKGLAAMVTAAALTITAMPITAAADITSVKVYVTTEDPKDIRSVHSGSNVDGLLFTAASSASNPTGVGVDKSLPFNAREYFEEYVPDFYELGDTWSVWGGADVEITSNGSTFNTQLVKSDTLLGTYSFADTPELTASMAQEAIDAAAQTYADGSSQFVLLKPEIKPIDYTVKIYDNFNNVLATFTTNCESDAFPAEELRALNYYPRLELKMLRDYSWVPINSDITSGKMLWNVIRNELNDNGDKYENGTIDINSGIYLTVNAPSVKVCSYEQYDNMSLLKTVSTPHYEVFTDGQITEADDSYISGRLSAGGLWVVCDRDQYGYYDYDKMKIVTGDKLAETVLLFSGSTDIEIVYLDSIFVYGKVAQTREDMEHEYGRDNPTYFWIDTQNLREYKFSTLPVDITDAAHELDIKPDDAAYDAKFYEPTDWNIWSWGIVTSGYISNDPVFVNKTFENGDDFKKVDYFLDDFMPLLQITKMDLINFDIPCAEAAGGKLTYTAEEHSVFPTKDGVTEWKFTYDGAAAKVKSSDELWAQIDKIVVTDGKTYDSSLASLTPMSAWDSAYDDRKTDSDGKTIVKVPNGDNTIPKDIIEKIGVSGETTIIEYPDGTEWEIDPDSVDIDRVPDDGVDLSVITKTEFATVINKVTGAQFKMQISIKHNGEFGFTATLIVDLSEGMKNAPAGDYFANLFHVKSDSDMEWKAYGKLDKNNIARLEFTHASDWAIIIDRDKLDGKTLKEVALTIPAPVKGGNAAIAPVVTGNAAVENFEWSPKTANGVFAPNTEYTLTVKLKPTADMDTVSAYLTATVNDSAASVSIDENAQTITVTYTFPKTEEAKVLKEIPLNVIEPIRWESSEKSPTTTNTQVTVESFEWSPQTPNGRFAPDTEYTLTVTLKPTADTDIISEYLTATVNGSAALVSVDESAQTITVTYTFPKTENGSTGGGSRPANPSVAYPSINGVSKPWSDIAADISKFAAGSEIVIHLNGNTTVPADVIKAIADRNISATFVVDSAFAWSVDGTKITVPAAADLTLIKSASTKYDSLRGTTGMQFKINNTSIPTELEISFKAAYAGKFANLYKSVNGKLIFVACAKLGADGKAVLPSVTETGSYIAMLCEFSDMLGDMNNDGILNAADASAVLRYIVGLETGMNSLMADFNGDGKVNAFDASAILNKIVGLE